MSVFTAMGLRGAVIVVVALDINKNRTACQRIDSWSSTHQLSGLENVRRPILELLTMRQVHQPLIDKRRQRLIPVGVMVSALVY